MARDRRRPRRPGISLRGAPPHLQGQSPLADSARTGQRQQTYAAPLQQIGGSGQILVSRPEGRERAWSVPDWPVGEGRAQSRADVRMYEGEDAAPRAIKVAQPKLAQVAHECDSGGKSCSVRSWCCLGETGPDHPRHLR